MGLALLALCGGHFREARADDALQNLKSRSSDQRWGRSAPAKASTAARNTEPKEMPGEPSRPPGGEPAARVALESLDTPPRPVGDPSPRKPTTASRYGRPISGDVRSARLQKVSQTAEDSDPKPAAPKLNGQSVPTETAPEPEPARPGSQGIRNASQLKRVSVILPYADYEPDPEIAAKDPCRNQCPRPGQCTGEPQLCPEELWNSGGYEPRLFPGSCFTWAASNIWYNPLYFQDVALERYGHTWCEPVQPFVSVAKFGTQLVFLPYQMAIDPPCKKEYALGYYRPGDCAPKLCYQPPLSVRGAIAEAGVVTGLFFLIP